jgi:uncharacterized iron-regulated membrane protein
MEQPGLHPLHAAAVPDRLPLIFHHEIGHLLGTEVEAPDLPKGTPRASLDSVMQVAQALHPGKVPMFASHEIDDDRFWYVTLGDTPTSEVGNKTVAVDARTAAVLAQPKFDEGFMYIMFKLHVDLFAGLAGKLFLGFMGFAAGGDCLGRGAVRALHAQAGLRRRAAKPAARQMAGPAQPAGRRDAGVGLHRGRDRHDQHLGRPGDQVLAVRPAQRMLAPYQGQKPPARLASVQQAASLATALAPEMKMAFIAFPGTTFSSPHHYTVFLRGNEPFNSRLLKPVLVDAGTNALTASPPLPWYLTALLVSQPLHFGDYGGMPMQILWALLDIATIIVLGSGLYLWVKRRNPAAAVKPATSVAAQESHVLPHKAPGGAA